MPGASKSKKLASLEKLATSLPFAFTAPTLTAVEIQAGADMLSVYPLFPAAITVAIPTEYKLSTVVFLESLSQ